MTATISAPVRFGRVAAFLAAAALAVSSVPAVHAAVRLVSVVVTAGSTSGAADAVRDAGGVVDETLPIVDGVAARVPASMLDVLSTRTTVVADRPMFTQSVDYGTTLTTAYPREVGATSLWTNNVTGSGVAVAVVDTGIADVPDLAGRVVASADLSGENAGGDGYGHGTFMAGLIAGNGASSGGRYVGVAPQANLVSVKVADRTGATNLSKVLMGVQLVRSSAQRFNVRVLLLALSSESPLPPDLDPLSTALRRVWASGVLVVVPSGNDGPASGSIASPGEDPVLLTVGSVDDRGTADVFDDAVSEWSGRGVTRWGDPKPDVAAPGEHLVSLRAPGSTVDGANPGSVVDGAYFKGSGTSMSSAVAAGAAALLFQERPGLSADAAKAILMGSATPIPAGDGDSVGAGVIDAAVAATLGDPGELPPMPEDTGDDVKLKGKWTSSDGVAIWDDKHGKNDEAAAEKWAGRQWAKTDWDGRQWAGRQWAGRQWAGRQWAYAQWVGRQWVGRQWAGRQWATQQWLGRQWAGRQWAGRQWAEQEWLGRQWAGRQWTDEDWEGRQWAGRQWTGRQWTGRQWVAVAWG